MDLGFVIVALSLIFPFAILAFGGYLKRRYQHEAALQALMVRAGIKQKNQHALKDVWQQGKKSRAFEWFETQFKKAGLIQQNIMIKWSIVQALLLFAGVYLLLTQSTGENASKAVIVGGLLPLLPMMFLLYKQYERREKMRKQFPEMLEGLVRTLQAGHGIDGALNEVAEMLPEPLGTEVKEIQRQFSLGIHMRDVLLEFQKRVDIPEARFFVVTLIIQRETGGQLTQILQELSNLMRRREVFQMKLKTMTAESRFTAWFLGLAPLLYLAYKYFFDYNSMRFFLDDPTGQKLLVISLVLMSIGALILRQMLKVRF